MADSRPSKLTVAVDDDRLRERLAALLGEHAIEVTFVPRLGTRDLEQVDADAIVVQADDLDPAALGMLERAREEGAPGVVVLGAEEGAHDELRMVAAGASAVVDGTADRPELGEQLASLIEAEAAGGLDGPEAGGSAADPRLADFTSRSERMRDFVDLVRRVAESDSTLLISGETGVGKERLARAIHAESPRAKGQFIAVNCGALPENLLDSELFGHEKGAFTGATQARPGRFELAKGGTILLDEIGEMDQHLQVKLLTVLQRHEIRRLGAKAPTKVDVRVISATNRDLQGDVAEGRFREDLLFRLNVVQLEIPPLRQRREDLPQLIGRFLRHFKEVHGRPRLEGIDGAALKLMLEYDWPGNVREVVNVVERAVLLARGKRIQPADLPKGMLRGGGGAAPGVEGASQGHEHLHELPLQEAKRRMVEEFEREYLTHHLESTGGAVGEVAERAHINPRTLYDKMKRYGLDKGDFK